ncbi:MULTISPECIES: hypothetical protein [unclassified Haladaptatus]|uniref:hypothetical protein n=1 Tax=unclassified Haladaptatus TaxID=2622732 RepID=UPI002FCDEA4D
MSLTDKIKGLVPGGEEKTYSYRCLECDTEFESPEQHMAKVECPNCHARGGRSIV